MTSLPDASEDPIRRFGATTGQSPVEAVRPPADATVLDELRDELSEEITGLTKVLRNPARPRWGVRYSSDIEAPILSRWAKGSKDKTQAEGLNALKLASTTLANQCLAVVRLGSNFDQDEDDCEDVLDEEGQVVTFGSVWLMDILGASRQVEACRKFYVKDGHLLKAWNDLLEASGYGDDDDGDGEADPTQRR